jgi:hypothetical protein
MKKAIFAIIITFSSLYFATAQVAINTTSATPDTSAMLDVSSTTKGMLVPRMTAIQRTTITTPATGLLVYDTTLGQFYYYNGSTWSAILITESDPKIGSLTNNYMPRWNGSTLTNSAIYDNTGTRISIGTTTISPESRLALGAYSATEGGQLQLNGNSLASVAYHLDNYDDAFRIMSGTNFVSSNVRMIIKSTGNMGIGTSDPTEKLEVSGKTKTTNLQVTNGATDGYILQTDATGNTSWVNPNTFSIPASLNSATNGYVLQTDATGNTSWVNPNTFINTNWTTSGSNQYNALSGNVGIGVSSPTSKLEVSGKTKTTTFQMTNGAANNYVLQSDASGNGSWVNVNTLTGAGLTTNYHPKWNGSSLINGILYDDGNSIGIGTTSLSTASTSYGSRLALGGLSGSEGGQLQLNHGTTATQTYFLDTYNDYFRIATGTDAAPTDIRMVISDLGNVGIGTSSPTEKLEVSGKTKTTTFQMTNGATNSYVLQSDASGNGTWVNPTTFSNNNWTTSGINQYSALTGNVGIGVTTPTSKLEVSGKTKTTTFQLTNGATNGYILQSDASGNASWVAASSSANWTVSGSNQYSALSGNIGIGTASPSTKLHVIGDATLAGTVNLNSSWNLQTGSDFYLEKSGTRYLTVYGTGGNIGIGTSAPNHKLDVQSTTSATAQVQSSGAGAFLSAVAPSGQEASANFKTYSSGSASNRWTVGKSTATEAGSNAGSNFFIDRQDDAGTYLGQPIAIDRQNGTVTVGNDGASATKSTFKVNGSTEVKLTTINASSTATSLGGNDYMVIYNGSTSGNSLSLPAASSCAGRVYMVINHSASSVIVTNTYLIANGTASPTISAGGRVSLVSDGSNWHKTN